MRICATVLGSLLLFATTGIVFADDEKKNSVEEPKEITVVDFDSKTHGALQVTTTRKNPVDWFDVLKDGKRVFDANPRLLNGMYEIPPGDYVAVVNRSERKVTIEAGKKTILLTGELMVEGKPDTAFWFPMQGKHKTVAAAEPLFNRALPLFAGKYTVYAVAGSTLNPKDLGVAEVKPGMKTVVKH